MTMQHKKPIDMDVLDVHEKPTWIQRWLIAVRDAVGRFTHFVSVNVSSDAETIPALHDVNAPVRSRWSLRVMVVGLLLLLIWSAVGMIDQVTRAQAQIIAAERTQLVQSPDGGVLTQLHVKEGEVVKAGQLLATLQKERAAAAVSDSSAKVAALRITLARLHAEVYGTPLVFEAELLSYVDYIRNQTDLYNRRQRAYKDDVNALENILSLAEDELRINRQLEATGDVSRAEVLRLQRSAADVRAQLAGKRNKYLQDAQAEMTKAQEELSTQVEQLRDRSQVLEHTELLAPVDGVVNNIKVNTNTTKVDNEIHHASMLFLPCANNSPKLGVPGGTPSPKKSSEVNAKIAALMRNGKNVTTGVRLLGSTWRHMICHELRPMARAART